MTLKDIFMKEILRRNYSKLERITKELLETDGGKDSKKTFQELKKTQEAERRLTDVGLLVYDVGKEQMQFFVEQKKFSEEIEKSVYALPYMLEVIIRDEHGEEDTKK